MKLFTTGLCAFFLLVAGVFPAFSESRVNGAESSRELKTASHFYLVPTFGGYSFSSGDDFKTGTLYGVRFGYQFEGEDVANTLGVEAFAASIDTRSQIDDDSATGYMFRMEAIYDLLKGRFVPFLSVGAGWLSLKREIDTDNRLILTPGVGAKYALTDHLDIRGDIRRALPFDPDDDSNWEYTVGLSYLFGKARTIAPPPPPDSDRDGVSDRADKCPGTPGGSKVDRFGCPPDSDGDGIPDAVDKCPGSPSGTKVDPFGCNPDTDGDGIPDDKDRCPGTPQGIEVDDQGCAPSGKSTAPAIEATAPTVEATAPTVETPTPIVEDPAPAAEAPTSAVKAPAPAAAPAPTAELPAPAPEVPDAGISPSEAITTKTTPLPLTGQKVPDPIVKWEGEPDLRVEFAFDRSNIRPKYHASLRQLAATIKASEELAVRIDGHTDSIGKVDYNQKLSWRRVESVKRYLIKLGVDSKRIFTQGFGPERPVADNNTDEGRQRNRRAVVTIISEEPWQLSFR